MTATLQVSRELSKNDALTFAYVNTGGRQLQWLHNLNLINPLGSLLDGRPVFDPRVNAGTRANPSFNNVTLQDVGRSEEHTSELQSRRDLVCRLLLEKKKIKQILQLSQEHHRHFQHKMQLLRSQSRRI